MFRVQETHKGNGEDLNGETPIRISVNSNGDSVHDDSSTLYHTGASGVSRTAEQTLRSGRPSIFALRSSDSCQALST